MAYVLRGVLEGLLCGECLEPLANVTVRLYRPTKEALVERATAAVKATYAILTEEEVEAKGDRLLAEGTADADGRFQIRLGEPYDGGALEIDAFVDTVPGDETAQADLSPVQLSITTIQPRWRETQDDLVAAFTHRISPKVWCAIRARLGIWVICGTVRHCQTEQPVPNVRVRAFDRDWLQDDPLGSALTDANGAFRIYYAKSTYRRTPFPAILLELTEGPDVYFRIETASGDPLLVESPSRGRDDDRENIGPCFCVDLCIQTDVPPPPDTTAEPQFTHVGSYAIASDFTPAGYTVSQNLAFTGTIPLIGILPNGGASPQEYRFRFGEYDPSGSTLGPLQNVEAGMIPPTKIGALQFWQEVSPGTFSLTAEPYYVNNPGAPHNTPVKPGGWIEVPTENDLGAPFSPGTGKFVRDTGVLIRLNTEALVDEFFDLTTPSVHEAGDSLASASKSRVYTFKLIFETQPVGNSDPTQIRRDELAKIVISNTSFKQERHPSWGGNTPTLRAVVMLDIQELKGAGNGCKTITDTVTALHSVYHPHLDSAEIYFEGNPPLPAAHTPAIASDGEASGSHAFSTASLSPCAYILWLQAVLNLTSGYGRITGATLHDHIAFCVGSGS